MKVKQTILIGLITCSFIVNATNKWNQLNAQDLQKSTRTEKQYSLSVGQVLNIELHANKTTGYQWNIVDSQQTNLQLKTKEYITEDAGICGVGGTEKMTFQAVKPGTTTLTFEYRRPWENGVQPAKIVTYTITIKEQHNR